MKKLILILIAGLAVGYFWQSLSHETRSVPVSVVNTTKAGTVIAKTQNSQAVIQSTIKIKASVPTQTAMQVLVESQVRQMSATDLNTAQVQMGLQKRADNFTITDLQNLENILLSSQNTQDERSVSLYLLSLSGAKALPALTRFSTTALPEFSHLQDPHSEGSLNKNFELSLRIAALETIDRQASAQSLQQILKTQNDPTLKMLAQVSLTGIQSGKPGKLGRFIQAMVNE